MIWLLVAVLACADKRPETPHPDPSVEPAPLVEPAPVVPSTNQVPMNARWEVSAGPHVLGEPVNLAVTYDLPNGCWRHASQVNQHPDTRTIELAVTLTQEGDLCTEAIVTVKENPELKPPAAGDWTFTVTFNGAERLRQNTSVVLSAPPPPG